MSAIPALVDSFPGRQNVDPITVLRVNRHRRDAHAEGGQTLPTGPAIVAAIEAVAAGAGVRDGTTGSGHFGECVG